MGITNLQSYKIKVTKALKQKLFVFCASHIDQIETDFFFYLLWKPFSGEKLCVDDYCFCSKLLLILQNGSGIWFVRNTIVPGKATLYDMGIEPTRYLVFVLFLL